LKKLVAQINRPGCFEQARGGLDSLPRQSRRLLEDVLDGGGDNADRSALPGRETDGPSWIKWAG